MRNILPRFLDAEAARIQTFLSGREIIPVFPVREPAMRQAAHAFHLVGMNLLSLLGLHENNRLVRRLHALGKACPR